MKYEVCYGLFYLKFKCEYNGIYVIKILFVFKGEDVEVWDVVIENIFNEVCIISVFNYVEFFFSYIKLDN